MKLTDYRQEELFEQAKDIWKKENNYKSFSILKRFWFDYLKEPQRSEIINIKNSLIEKLENLN